MGNFSSKAKEHPTPVDILITRGIHIVQLDETHRNGSNSVILKKVGTPFPSNQQGQIVITLENCVSTSRKLVVCPW